MVLRIDEARETAALLREVFNEVYIRQRPGSEHLQVIAKQHNGGRHWPIHKHIKRDTS